MKLGIKVSYNIKRIMKEKKIKQYELAEKLGKTPENMSYFFSNLESGKGTSILKINEIAKVLNVDISNFFI